MGQRVNVLWGILLSLLVVSMIWIGYSNYKMSKQVDKLKQQRITLGTDEQLEETVRILEKNLNDRLAYQTSISVNPLDLTRVITSRKFLASLGLRETLEQQGRMRLSATVTGDSPSAVIKFMGRSYVVHEGDTFNGFQVAQISQAQLVMTKAGSRLVLVNEAAPEGEFETTPLSSSVSGENY